MVQLILAERRRHPSWGPKKLKDVLERQLGHALPAPSTIGSMLDRNGLVDKRRYRPRHTSRPTTLRQALAPNEVWCIDYKGQFRLGNGSYCYPLTITDQYSRFLLGCEGMSAINDEAARDTCAEIFRTYGLPLAMRSDNGVPFASTGLAGLTKLSVYWLRLGIALERIRPAHPQDNARTSACTAPSSGRLHALLERTCCSSRSGSPPWTRPRRSPASAGTCAQGPAGEPPEGPSPALDGRSRPGAASVRHRRPETPLNAYFEVAVMPRSSARRPARRCRSA